MKGMKGKLLKKLKTVKAIGYLKPERILQVNALDGYLYTSPPKPALVSRLPLTAIDEEPKEQPCPNLISSPTQQPEIIDVKNLMKDLEDEETDFDYKENFRPEIKGLKVKSEISEEREFGVGKRKPVPLSEIDVGSFRRPDLNSKTLFDPNLLAAFEQAVVEVKALEADRRSRIEFKSTKIDQIADPLTEFEEKCPPGGGDAVVVYTTGLRGIRKTFEDCQKVRSLLENLRMSFIERDIWMHSEFKEELWRMLGGKMVPPRLFIKGRYIGGAEEVMVLHEQGKLKPLMAGILTDRREGCCEGCVGFRFMVCLNCNGSRKIRPEPHGQTVVCAECNENGLIVCPFCC